MPVITKRLLDSIKPDGKLHVIGDDDLIGFGVQVTPAGRISFCVTYRLNGQNKRRVIGRYGPLTPEQARKTARIHLGRASGGEDPLAPTPSGLRTLNEVYEAWMERHVAVHCRPNTARSYRSFYEANCRKSLGRTAPDQLTFASISAEHARLSASPTAGNHLIRTLRAMLSWAEDQRLVVFKDGNPAKGHRLYKETPKDRILTVPEIRTFIAGLPNAAMEEGTRRALLLELLLAQRSGEIASMKKADVDLHSALWTIPGDDNKGKRTHLVPLPPWSRDIIGAAYDEAQGIYLFPSGAGDPTSRDAVAMDSHALSTAMSRAQRPLDEQGKPEPRTKDSKWVFDFRDRARAPSPITPHDLRRTASSYLELLGFGEAVRGAILNHSKNQSVTTRHYSAADLLKLKRSALLQWEAALRQIVAGGDPFARRLEDDRAEEARVLGLE